MALTDLTRVNVFPSLNPFWDDFLNNSFEPIRSMGTFKSVPSANISESEKEYSIELAAPGLTKNDFKVDVENGMLSISSELEESKEENEKNYSRKEYSYTSFNRSFRLPDNANEDKIYARYEDGVLTITIEKEAAKEDTKKSVSID